MKLHGDSIHVFDEMYNLISQHKLYEIDIIMFEVKYDNKIEGKNCFIYKIITCPIRANILDVYSNLEKWIVVLADPVVFM